MSDQSILCRNGELIRTVQNLGWLLAHDEEVWMIEVRPRYGRPREAMAGGCYLVAHLEHNASGYTTYETPFADHTICLDWLSRPKFIGKRLDWFGLKTTVPKAKQSSAWRYARHA